jgi:hypothetical protein
LPSGRGVERMGPNQGTNHRRPDLIILKKGGLQRKNGSRPPDKR